MHNSIFNKFLAITLAGAMALTSSGLTSYAAETSTLQPSAETSDASNSENTSQIAAFMDEIPTLYYTLGEAPSFNDLLEEMPTELSVTFSDGTTGIVAVEDWACDYYDPDTEGSYVLTPSFAEIYDLSECETPEAYVIIAADVTSHIESENGSGNISLAIEGSSTADTENRISKIEQFTTEFVSGADQVSTDKDEYAGNDYVWTPKNNAKDHRFKYRVNYAYSVAGSIPAETIKITVPRSILTDRTDAVGDSYEMSYPSREEIAEMTDSELAEQDGFAYYDDGTQLVIYNFRELNGAIKGSFEIAYVTTKKTEAYYDYGHKDGASKVFTATTTVPGLDSQTSTAPCVNINTTATITSTTKKMPKKLYKKWQSSWGTEAKPDNDTDYYYLMWEIESYITDNDTQYYTFTLTDKPTSTNGAVTAIAYRFSGQSTFTKNNYISGISGDKRRYDYVITALKKSDFASLTSWTVTNNVAASVTPEDKVDAVTTASSTKKYSWTQPVYVHPTGHFYVWKFGNENWDNLFGSENNDEWPYASYSLDELQDQTIDSLDDIKYAIWGYGYPFPWTVKDGTTGSWSTYVDDLNASKVSDPYALGYKNVTYTLTDDTFYPQDAEGKGTSKTTGTTQTNTTLSEEKYNETDASDLQKLASEDYDISYLSLSANYIDVYRNSDGVIASEDDVINGKATNVGFDEDEQKFNTYWRSYSDDDVLTIYTKSGDNDYVKAGTVNLKTKEVTKTEGSLIDSASSDNSKWEHYGNTRITFKAGVDGVKIQDTNNYYYSEYKIYTYISIKGTDPVLGWVRSGTYGSANMTTHAGTTEDPYEDQVILKNVVNMTVDDYAATYDDAGNLTAGSQIFDLTKVAGDRFRKTQRSSQITKEITSAHSYPRNKTYKISWTVTAYESFLTGSTDESQYLQQSSGTFYDLLPAGSTLDADSVVVWRPTSATAYPAQNSSYKNDAKTQIDSSRYEVSTIENYKGSGRTMLIVKIDQPSLYYYVQYRTVHSWDSIADFGKEAVNPVAYETGNDTIYGGYPDNGGVGTDSDGNVTHKLSHDAAKNNNEYYYTDLDPDTDDNKFIYAEQTHDIEAVLATSSGLNKRIKAADDSTWVYDTTTTTNGTYQYRLRTANSFLNSSKNMIFYDSLENSSLVDGADAPTSDWHGTLTSIDLSQLKQAENVDSDGNGTGVYMNPVAYVSTVSDLDLDGASTTTSGTNLDLTNSEIWTKYDAYYTAHNGDLSAVKAVAIDMRKDTSGNDFILPKGGSLSAVLYMQAPPSAKAKTGAAYPWAYNSIYLHETTIDLIGQESTSTINQNYTSIRFVVTANVGVHKVSEEDPSKNISGITFRIKGTSDYGTDVDEMLTTGRNGVITFKKIEKGTYMLQEYSATVDWVEDHTEHTVVIGDGGEVTIDGTDYTDSQITIQNTPRVHTDVTFQKSEMFTVSANIVRDLAGSKFKLYGTSDYGNEIVKYAEAAEKTNAQGEGTGQYYVTFKDVEMGTYSLVETSCADTYVKNPCIYQVSIDKNGNISMKNTTPKSATITTETAHTETVSAVKHAHTANIDDTGTATASTYNNSVNYSATATATVDGQTVDENLQTVSIPGAEQLEITVTIQSESTSYDWLYIYSGAVARSSSADNGTGGTLVASKLGGSTKKTYTYTVDGDTATFVWRTDESGNSYYGYYATISATYDETTYTTSSEVVDDIYAVRLQTN